MGDMNTVRIVSKSTVRPANVDYGGEFRRRIELTPFDLYPLQQSYTQRGLLFQKPAGPTVDLVELIKAALARALDIFFPLAGRLKATEDGDMASFFIDCNREGALFVHAIAESVAAADVLAEPVAVPEETFRSFFLMSRVLNCEAALSKLPLLAVQVTELSDGVFLAYTSNHVAGDGTSLWHFLNVWSEISRCGNELLPQHFRRPVFSREFLDSMVDLPLSIPFSRDRIHHGIIFPTKTLQSRNFRFSKDKITELKAKANAAESETNVISSLQALMAHLWVCVTRSRRLNPEDEVIKIVAVGLRQRLQPPLPQEYFGNAVRTVVVKTTAGELLQRGMVWAARQINTAIATQSLLEVSKICKDWVKEIRQGPGNVKRMPSSSLIIASSPRFDVYGNDFGCGRPLALRTGPATQFDGRVLACAGAEEGSIDLEVCLVPETLRALANDAEFAGTIAK